jgi:hypothetical protein
MNTPDGVVGLIPLRNEDGIAVALLHHEKHLSLCFYKKPYT